MASVDIIDQKNQKLKSVPFSDEVLTKKVNMALLYQAIKRAFAGKHHGTVRTKTRSEVLRTSKKVYRQKGTGNARHGSRKSSPYVGGGRVFGPKPRDYTLKLNKKMKQLAFKEALRTHLIEGSVTVLDGFSFTQPKTKEAAKLFGGLKIDSGLVVLEGKSDGVEKSIRNLKGFQVTTTDQLALLDIMSYPRLVFTEKAFQVVSEKYLQ